MEDSNKLIFQGYCFPIGNPQFLEFAKICSAEESFKPTLASGKPLFIPKKKKAELGVTFPFLGCTTSQLTEKKENENTDDPCHGKPKEFFIYEYDASKNEYKCKGEQLTFIAAYYPDHYQSPIDILMWLYDMAEYRDETKCQAKDTSDNKDTYQESESSSQAQTFFSSVEVKKKKKLHHKKVVVTTNSAPDIEHSDFSEQTGSLNPQTYKSRHKINEKNQLPLLMMMNNQFFALL